MKHKNNNLKTHFIGGGYSDKGDDDINSIQKHKIVHENYIKVGQPIIHDEPTASYFRKEYFDKIITDKVYDKTLDSKKHEGLDTHNLFNIHDTTYNIKHNFMKDIKFYFKFKDKAGKEILYLMNNDKTWSTIYVDEKSSEDMQYPYSNNTPEFEEFKKKLESDDTEIRNYIQTEMPIPILLQIYYEIDYINSDDAPQYMKDLMNYIRNEGILDRLKGLLRPRQNILKVPDNETDSEFTNYIKKIFKDPDRYLWEILPLYLETLLKKGKYELIKKLFYGEIKTYKELDKDIDCSEDKEINIVLLRYLQLIIGRDKYYLLMK